MSTKCNLGVDVPETLLDEPCNGEYTSSACIVNPTALSYLNLPINTPVNVVFNNILLAFQYKDEQIAELITRIETLENV